MKSPLEFDFEAFPPFEGFPQEGIKFLRRLKTNNNREWFTSHKSEYEDFVKLPMQALIASLRPLIGKLAPDMEVNPRRSMFRIYRDVRFSKNKDPYKTHAAAIFHPKGHWEQSAGYYLHIEPGNIYVGGGVYMPDGAQLKKIRSAIAAKSEEFLAIVKHKRFVQQFSTLEGEKLQRMPLGYPADHPMGEWLKFKSFYTGVEWKERECYDEEFLDKVVKVYRDLLPLIRFLNSSLGA